MKNDLKRLNIELSAHCSYACVSCPNTYMTRKKGHMALESFMQIYDEIEDRIQKVFLWNYGEPLLNPNVSEILLYTANKKPKTSLSTTGEILSSKDNLSFLGVLDELIISINGFDSETYSFHQKQGDFSKVVSGLKRIKPIMERSETEYVLQIVVNAKNIEQITKAEHFARENGFDKVVFKSFNVMDNKEETKEQYIPKGSTFTRDSPFHRSSEIFPCNEWMVINWDGDVDICCWDYDSKIFIGNVLELGVFGVWDSERMAKLKKRISREKILPYCGNCTIKTKVEELVIK